MLQIKRLKYGTLTNLCNLQVLNMPTKNNDNQIYKQRNTLWTTRFSVNAPIVSIATKLVVYRKRGVHDIWIEILD